MWTAMSEELRGRRVCTTNDCFVPARWRFEHGDVVSFYCSPCRTKIERDKAMRTDFDTLHEPGRFVRSLADSY
jgi:hypothetical protein